MDIFQKYLQTPMRIKKNKNKRIKENLLETIIEAFVKEAPHDGVDFGSDSLRKPGTVWRTSKGVWGGKRENGDTKYGFKDRESAQRWVDNEPRLGGPDDDELDQINRALDQDPKSKSTSRQRSQRQPTGGEEPGTQTTAQDIDKMVDKAKAAGELPSDEPVPDETFETDILNTNNDLYKQRKNGNAGRGGRTPSFFEQVFTQTVNRITSGEFLEKLRGNTNFEKYRESYAKISQKATKLRNKTAQDMGFVDYDDKNQDHRTSVAEYLALRESFVQELKDEELAWKIKDSTFRTWAEGTFDGVFRLYDLIESDDPSLCKLDPTQPYYMVQSEDSEAMMEDGLSPDQKIKQQLERLRDSSEKEEDRKHYQRELDLFDELGFSDTLVVGKDRNGRLSVFHDSNKASRKLDDIQANGGPADILQKLKERYQKNIPESIAMVATLNDGIEALSDANFAAVKNSMGIEIDDDLCKIFNDGDRAAGRGLPMQRYIEELDNNQKFRNWASKQDVSSYEKLSNCDKVKLMQQHAQLANDPSSDEWVNKKGNLTQPPFLYAKLFIKASEYSKPDEMSDGVKACRDLQQGHKDGVNGAYQSAVKKIHQLDKESCLEGTWDDIEKTCDGKNGIHTQLYISHVLEMSHLESHIKNYDGDLVLSSGPHAVLTSETRQAVFDMMPEEIRKTVDPKTPEGRKLMLQWLVENSRIDSDRGALRTKVGEEERELILDRWRTAGDAKKVALQFGKELRDDVVSKTQKRRASFWDNFGSAKQPQESAPPELRKLIRDIALWKLGKYGN